MEYKFRDKRIDNGEWVYGSLIQDRYTLCYIQWIEKCNCTEGEHTVRHKTRVLPETVSQYTGLNDKNKLNEIFEYDIISKNGEKVGNYYENSNLLKDSVNLLIERMGTKKRRDTEQKAIERGCQYAE